MQPLTRTVALWTQMQSIMLARGRVEEGLALPQEDDGPFAGAAASADEPPLGGEIAIRGLTFGFGDAPALIDGLDLHVRPGEFIAIQGTSGAGKTTLLQLIMGMGTPRGGEILFDGRPLHRIGAANVRAQIAFLPQQPTLFRGTLRDNLLRFAGHEVEDRALELANRLGLNDVIARLPQGLETWIGDDMSYALPAGVRQKIAIIRALVADAPIILFDEANSNFDQEGDRHLAGLVEGLRGKKTIVLVSHRPSLLRMADLRYDLADGRLSPVRPVEDGR
ncbi:MAG: ATP-binding cassette domain-containing protein [Alphaproteobacteria bacterium]